MSETHFLKPLSSSDSRKHQSAERSKPARYIMLFVYKPYVCMGVKGGNAVSKLRRLSGRSLCDLHDLASWLLCNRYLKEVRRGIAPDLRSKSTERLRHASVSFTSILRGRKISSCRGKCSGKLRFPCNPLLNMANTQLTGNAPPRPPPHEQFLIK